MTQKTELVQRLDASKEPRAKYKLEVLFSKGRTSNGPNLCAISVWESAGMTIGEGDNFLGFCPYCPAQVVRRPDGDTDNVMGFCDTCKRPFKATAICDHIMLRIPTSALAEKIEKIFHQLAGDMDLVLKFHREDIRYQKNDFDVDALDKARRERHSAMYRFQRIMDDTSKGARPKDLFETFLKA